MKTRMQTFAVFMLLLAAAMQAQDTNRSGNAVSVPRLVRFNGTLKDGEGKPLAGVVGVTFSLYSEPTGGGTLWLETQNVQTDGGGHYTILLGSTKPDALPLDLFASGEARWLGVQPDGQAEQARVLLVSTPYALKAADAETVGGLPASAFVRSNLAAGQGQEGPLAAGAATAANSHVGQANVAPAATAAAITGSGRVDFLPLWTGTSSLGSSNIFQNSNKLIGIGTTSPMGSLDVNGTAFVRGAMNLPARGVATAALGQTSFPLNLTASTFKAGAPVSQTFRWQAEPMNNNQSNASGSLNLLYAAGTATPAETGISLTATGSLNVQDIRAFSVFASAAVDAAAGVFQNMDITGFTAMSGPVAVGRNSATALMDINGGGAVDTLIGDPGCGPNFAGIGFGSTALSGCSNYALVGDNLGALYLNSHNGGSIQFRNNSNFSPDQMIILANGNVGIGTNAPGTRLDVAGPIRSQNLTQQVSTTTATSSSCSDPTPGLPPPPNSKCAVLGMSFTNTLSPLFVMANINGIFHSQCSDVFLLLVLDGTVIGSTVLQGDPSSGASMKSSASVSITPGVSIGSHSLNVQLFDDFSGCGGIFVGPTAISTSNASSTLMVHEW